MLICGRANCLADQIRATISELGYELFLPGCTNQIFPILPNALLEELKKHYVYSEMQPVGNDSRVVRFCTSWATKQENVDALCRDLKKFSHMEKI